MLGVACCWLMACAGSPDVTPDPTPSLASFRALDHARFIWVSAQCVDGVLELGKNGFERSLTSELDGKGLRFTYDTHLAQPSCESTEIWSLQLSAAGMWQFSQEAEVRLPATAACGASGSISGQGMLQLQGDTLEELRFGSPWCRGFDARFVYRRVPDSTLSRDELIRRYVAHWNRRDAHAVAGLFSPQGLLIEPFSRSSDGTPVRHDGRDNVEAWLSQAFSSVPWLALQLSNIASLDDQDQMSAGWRYRDPRLAEPLSGRNLFVLAGGEIFATELQLVSEPVPVATASQTAP
jgi:hypothetical protein